jgi:hypothetical protein
MTRNTMRAQLLALEDRVDKLTAELTAHYAACTSRPFTPGPSVWPQPWMTAGVTTGTTAMYPLHLGEWNISSGSDCV